MNIAKSVKVAVTETDIANHAAIVTTLTGMSHAFDWIPDDIGKGASLLGIITTIGLAYFKIKKDRADIRLMKAKTKEIIKRTKHGKS